MSEPRSEDQPVQKVDRILWIERPSHPRALGCIDEIVLHNATVHIEQMSDRCWWIGIYLDDERYWMGNFTCDSRGRMNFTEQENAGIEWYRDDTHEEPYIGREAQP